MRRRLRSPRRRPEPEPESDSAGEEISDLLARADERERMIRQEHPELRVLHLESAEKRLGREGAQGSRRRGSDADQRKRARRNPASSRLVRRKTRSPAETRPKPPRKRSASCSPNANAAPGGMSAGGVSRPRRNRRPQVSHPFREFNRLRRDSETLIFHLIFHLISSYCLGAEGD